MTYEKWDFAIIWLFVHLIECFFNFFFKKRKKLLKLQRKALSVLNGLNSLFSKEYRFWPIEIYQKIQSLIFVDILNFDCFIFKESLFCFPKYIYFFVQALKVQGYGPFLETSHFLKPSARTGSQNNENSA